MNRLWKICLLLLLSTSAHADILSFPDFANLNGLVLGGDAQAAGDRVQLTAGRAEVGSLHTAQGVNAATGRFYGAWTLEAPENLASVGVVLCALPCVLEDPESLIFITQLSLDEIGIGFGDPAAMGGVDLKSTPAPFPVREANQLHVWLDWDAGRFALFVADNATKPNLPQFELPVVPGSPIEQHLNRLAQPGEKAELVFYASASAPTEIFLVQGEYLGLGAPCQNDPRRVQISCDIGVMETLDELACGQHEAYACGSGVVYDLVAGERVLDLLPDDAQVREIGAVQDIFHLFHTEQGGQVGLRCVEYLPPGQPPRFAPFASAGRLGFQLLIDQSHRDGPFEVEITNECGPLPRDAGVDAGPVVDAGPTADAALDAGPRVDAALDAEVATDAGLDARVSPDAGLDAGLDAGPDPMCPVRTFLQCNSAFQDGPAAQNEVSAYPACSKARAEGPELRYVFRPTVSGTFIFTLSGLAAGRDLDLYILEGQGCDPDACAAASIEVGSQVDEISAFEGVAGRTYFVVVEGVDADDVSEFELALRCLTPPGPAPDASVDSSGLERRALPELGVQGSGCDVNHSKQSSGLWLLGVFALLLRRRRFALVLLALLAAGQSRAEPLIDIQRFDPAPQLRGFSLLREAALGKPSIGGQIFLNYAHSPLELGEKSSGERFFGIVDHLVGLDVAVAGVFTPWLEVGFNLPVLQSLTFSGAAGELLATGLGHSGETLGIGDLQLHLAFTPLQQGENAPFSLALVPHISLPTGSNDAFLGAGRVGLGGGLAAGLRLSSFALTTNLGYTYYTDNQNTGNLVPGDTLHFGVGLALPLLDGVLEPQLEFVGQTLVDGEALDEAGAELFDGANTPMELLFGVLIGPKDSMAFYRVGGSLGIGPGFGTPDFRLFAAFGLQHLLAEAPPPVDLPPPPPLKKVTARLKVEVRYLQQIIEDIDVVLTDKEGKKQTLRVGKQAAELEVEAGSAWTGTAARDCLSGTGSAEVPAQGGEIVLKVAMVPNRSVPVELDLKDKNGAAVDGATARWNSEPSCIGCVPEEPIAIPGGLLRQQVCPGTHDLFVEKKGYRIVHSRITAEEGTLQKVQVDMKPTQVEVKKARIEILEKVYFDFDKDTIQPRSFELLDEVAATILANPQMGRLEVAGHTDSKGKKAYNLDLSNRRAQAVQRHLVAKGVPAPRLQAMGYGDAQPLSSNATEKGRDQNRRVEFRILGP